LSFGRRQAPESGIRFFGDARFIGFAESSETGSSPKVAEPVRYAADVIGQIVQVHALELVGESEGEDIRVDRAAL
jgi:hypothetical protein